MRTIAFTLFAILPLAMVSCKIKVTTNSQAASAQPETQQVADSLSFPMETGFTKEFLQGTFWKCNYDSAGDTLAYWVILPKTLRPVRVEPLPIGETKLVNIGQYERTNDEEPYLEVWVMTEPVTDGIEPADWLRQWLAKSNETILHEKEILGDAGGRFLDVLSSKPAKEGDTSISRCTVYRSGRNYFFIKVSCSIEDYEAMAKTIRHISASWGIKI